MKGSRLRERRKSLGISQSRLSVMTGIPQTTISGWERGISEPTVGEAQKLAQALQTTIEDLFELTLNEISLANDSTSGAEATQHHEHTA